MASTESCGFSGNGLNESCLFTRIGTPPPGLSGRFFLRILNALNLTRQDSFQWVSLKRAISGLTKDRKCRNSSSLALVSSLAFHWTYLKLLDGFGVVRWRLYVWLSIIGGVHVVLPVVTCAKHRAESV